ncbi:SRPBCC family protein [Rhodococcus koreensis]
MSPIASTFEIDRPPDVVFSYATDPSRFAEWQHDVVQVRGEGDRPAEVGARFTTTRRIGRAQRTMTQEVTEIDPPRRWAVRGVDGPVRPNVTITIDPLGDGARSRVTIALDFEGHGIGKLIVPLAVRRLARKGAPTSYRNLQERLQGGR